MTLGMAKKRNRNKRIKYTDFIERNFKKKTVQVCVMHLI